MLFVAPSEMSPAAVMSTSPPSVTVSLPLVPSTVSEPVAISRVEPEYQTKVRNNVILTGGSSLISGLGAALQEALKDVGGGKVRVVKDPAFVGADGGLAIATDAPDSDWETLST